MQEYLKIGGSEADQIEEPSPVKTPQPASAPPRLRDPDAPRDQAALRASGIAALVKVGGAIYHLIAGLNADQYAAEISGQLAGPAAGGVPSPRGAAA